MLERSHSAVIVCKLGVISFISLCVMLAQRDHYDTSLGCAYRYVCLPLLSSQLDNLTLMEINTTRSFLLDSLNCMYKLRTNVQPSTAAEKTMDY